MIIITSVILPFCFGFITARAFRKKDMAMVVVATIGFIAALVLIVLTEGVTA